MPTVTDLTEPYGNFLLAPRPGPGVCEVCLDLTAGPPRCHHCVRPDPGLAAVAAISYSVDGEQLHHALAGYKRPPTMVAERFQVELAAVLWRHLTRHEACLARAAGVTGFDVVTTVPSSRVERDATHPLRRIVGELAGPTRDRYAPTLHRTTRPLTPRAESPEKFAARPALDGRAVLLIDDTWTTGANARSAAAALSRAGAGAVAVLAIGRHLHRGYRDNARRLAAVPRPFDWETCAHHTRGDLTRATVETCGRSAFKR